MRMNINPANWFTSKSVKSELMETKGLLTKYQNEFGIPMFGGNNIHAGVKVTPTTAI